MNDMKKNEKNPRSGNLAHMFGIFALVSAAASLSVVGSVLFVDVMGALCTASASALFACLLFLVTPALVRLSAAVFSAAAGFLATYLICGDTIKALAGLVYVIVGAIVYLGVKNKRARTKITFGALCFLVLFHSGLVVLYFLLKTGGFSIGMVSSAVDAGLTETAEFLTGRVAALSQLPETDRAAYVRELVANTKAMTPALFVLYNAAVAYLSTSFFRYAYNVLIPMANPGRKKIKNKYWRLAISLVSAVAAALALFASLFVSFQKNPLPSIILTNLTYMLAPGFCIVGIYFFHDKVFKEKTGVFSVVLAVCALVAVLVLPAALFALALVLMVSGLYDTLAGDMKKFLEKAKKNLFGDDDDDDDKYIE